MYPLYMIIPTSIIALLVVYYFLKSLFPKPKVGDYDNKYVLITGCDTGFGKNTAILLDQMGFHVIAGCLTKEGKDNLQTVCSDRLVSVLMDVTDSKQIQDVYAVVKNIVGDKGVWAVINNAGIMITGPLEWFKMKDYKKLADVNLWGLIEITKTFLPLVKKAEGRIVNISSAAGLVSLMGLAAYCVTKYGVEAFSDALRREMVDWNVKVSIVEPAQPFATPLLAEISGKKFMSLWEGISDEMRQEYGKERFEKALKWNKLLFENAICPDVGLVVNTLVDAVTSRDPAPRYLIGPIAMSIRVACMMPTSLQDLFFNFKAKQRAN